MATALETGAGGVTPGAAKDRGGGVFRAFTLAKLVEAFAVVGIGLETAAMGLGATALLPSIVEFCGAFLSWGVAGTESPLALLVPVDLVLFLVVTFTEFIFKFA